MQNLKFIATYKCFEHFGCDLLTCLGQTMLFSFKSGPYIQSCAVAAGGDPIKIKFRNFKVEGYTHSATALGPFVL